VTEAEWLACLEPQPMLEHLQSVGVWRTRAGRRKMRLFSCACCRRIGDVLDHVGRTAVAVCEEFAEGRLSKPDVSEFQAGLLHGHLRGRVRPTPQNLALWACEHAISHSDLVMRARSVAYLVRAVIAGGDAHHAVLTGAPLNLYARYPDALRAEEAAQCSLLRCLSGNPFRPVAILLTWRTPSAVGLARAAYEEQKFDLLPVLGDALEDSGCAESALLGHLRGPGPHLRACWALELLLAQA
jgi:hypothetical protein